MWVEFNDWDYLCGMNLPFIHKYYFRNFKPEPVNSSSFFYPSDAIIVYEIIRVFNGVYLFLEDHLDRLESSLLLTKLPVAFNRNEILQQLCDLIKYNDCSIGNVRIELIFHNGTTDFLAGFVPHAYPPNELYIHGINVVPLQAIRTNPNAKIFQQELRQKVENILADKEIYEVILVNEKGMITEGSKSNFFAIVEGKIFTPPLYQVLPGVTRRQILFIAAEQGIPLSEEPIPLKQIDHYEALFISGTSPKILPIAKFGTRKFDPLHPTLVLLRQLYDQRIDQYIFTHQHICKKI